VVALLKTLVLETKMTAACAVIIVVADVDALVEVIAVGVANKEVIAFQKDCSFQQAVFFLLKICSHSKMQNVRKKDGFKLIPFPS
jgi:hypothetical protein